MSRRALLVASTAALMGMAILLLVGCLWVNYVSLKDAYGSGPPYYGRTTNMDKWVNPLPMLALLDGIALLVVLGLGALSRRLVTKSRP